MREGIDSFESLTSIVKSGSKWTDDYPARQKFADEFEVLLEFLKSHGQSERYVGRLRGSNKQRNAALMELRVARHLEIRGFRIVDWSPIGASGNEGEFVVEGSAKQRVFVEVKGPEWQSEVPKDELIAGRSEQPKYIDGEGRSIPPRFESIQFAVDKAYKKFRDDTPNLLVVADNLFVSLEHETEFEVGEALYSHSPTDPGYFTDRRYEKLGGVGVLLVGSGIWVSEDKEGLRYDMRLFLNPKAKTTTMLPPDVQREFQHEASKPEVFLVGREPTPLEKYLANSSEWN